MNQHNPGNPMYSVCGRCTSINAVSNISMEYPLRQSSRSVMHAYLGIGVQHGPVMLNRGNLLCSICVFLMYIDLPPKCMNVNNRIKFINYINTSVKLNK
jgi:hypothetical protein